MKIFTTHTHKQLFRSFQLKIWPRHSLRRPWFPIGLTYFYYWVTVMDFMLCFCATTSRDLAPWLWLFDLDSVSYTLSFIPDLHTNFVYTTIIGQTLTVALVNQRLDYGNSTLVGIPAYLIRRLQSALNAAARLIFHLRLSDHVTNALVSLHFAACTGANPIQDRRADTQSSPVVTHHGTWGRSPLLLMSLVDGHWVLLEPTAGCASS